MTFRKLWEALGSSGELKEGLGSSGKLWAALGSSGKLWEALGSSGNVWRVLRSFGKLCELLVRIGKYIYISSYTAAPGSPMKSWGSGRLRPRVKGYILSFFQNTPRGVYQRGVRPRMPSDLRACRGSATGMGRLADRSATQAWGGWPHHLIPHNRAPGFRV